MTPLRDIHRSNDIEIDAWPVTEVDQAKFNTLWKKDPYEAVVYLASHGKDEQALALRDSVFERVREKALSDARAELARTSPLTDGVLISGPDANDRFIVGVGGSRFDMQMVIAPRPTPQDLVPGREVWVSVNRETMVIAKLRDTYVQGEAVPVLEVVNPPDETKDEHTAQTDQDKRESGKPKPLLLKIRSRQEEVVVEALPALADKKPRAGDIVRAVPSLGVALDLLSRGRQDVLLDRIPDVTYEDIGGLDAEITQIREAIEDPYVHPEVFQRYKLQRPRGILLYGPPGCGKTMIAKAIANSLSQQIERSLHEMQAALDLYAGLIDGRKLEDIQPLYRDWQAAVASPNGITGDAPQVLREGAGLRHQVEGFLRNRGVTPDRVGKERERCKSALAEGSKGYFISIKGPELLSKWVGETESSIRGIFTEAREKATFYTPVVLFFDELESMFSRRGSGISSDVQKTIVPQLLAEIDGIEETHNVIVIGASNRFDLIDPAVLRPGRLDFKLKIPRPDRKSSRAILTKYLTVDVPFPPADIGLSADAAQLLGPIAAGAASLVGCLSAALENLTTSRADLVAALWLNEVCAGGRPPGRQLDLRAASGLSPESRKPLVEQWAAADGIAWKAADTGQKQVQAPDPACKEDNRGVTAWPIVAPAQPGVVWGALVVGYPGVTLAEDDFRHVENLVSAIADAILARQMLADRLSERVLDIIFHKKSRLLITELAQRQSRPVQEMTQQPRKLEKHVQEIVSGAMLESIVARAKRAAVKRELGGVFNGNSGVTWDDLYEAIRIECEESKDQYIYELYGDESGSRDQTYHDTERFHVDVRLPPPDAEAAPLDPQTRKERDAVSTETTPDVTYEDVGGLDAQIAQIREAIEEPYLHSTVFQRYALKRPRGILLYGPPGCGKTMVAKAIANSLTRQIAGNLEEVGTALRLYLNLRRGGAEGMEQLFQRWREIRRLGSADPATASGDGRRLQLELERFLSDRGIAPMQAAEELQEIEAAIRHGGQSYFVSIKGPELLSKWVGEAEANIRNIFASARERATFYTPVVLFFDEIEALFSRRGSGISSDMQKTVVPQLLAELDGLEEMRHIIVIGATNRFDLLDPAVLRPGRFDLKIRVARPDRNGARAILAKYLGPDVPLPPTSLGLSEFAVHALGPEAATATALANCLTAALDNLIGVSPGCKAALFLTGLYTGGRQRARKLELRAVAGVAPEQRKAVTEAWSAPEGIAWAAVRAGVAQGRADDVAWKGDGGGVTAWPIVAPDQPGVVWGALVVGYPGEALPEGDQRRAAELVAALAEVIRVRQALAGRLCERTLDLVFHDLSRVVVAELLDRERARQLMREPRTLERKVRDIVSGAMLESVVTRAKRFAVQRELGVLAPSEMGLTWSDLYAAIRAECEESKDQYIYELHADDPYGRGTAYQDLEQFSVTVSLPPADVSVVPVAWLTSKAYAWRCLRPVATRGAQ